MIAERIGLFVILRHSHIEGQRLWQKQVHNFELSIGASSWVPKLGKPDLSVADFRSWGSNRWWQAARSKYLTFFFSTNGRQKFSANPSGIRRPWIARWGPIFQCRVRWVRWVKWCSEGITGSIWCCEIPKNWLVRSQLWLVSQSYWVSVLRLKSRCLMVKSQ